MSPTSRCELTLPFNIQIFFSEWLTVQDGENVSMLDLPGCQVYEPSLREIRVFDELRQVVKKFDLQTSIFW